MSKEQKLTQSICNHLYIESKGKIRLDSKTVKSTRNILNQDNIKEIEKHKEYFDQFNENVTFIDNIKNPTGIYKFMKKYADMNGKEHTKKVIWTNNETGEKYEKEIFDYYEPNDPDEYVVIIVDHAALLNSEKGMSLHQTITKLSSDYFVTLRNKYNYIPVLIQQQSSAQESVENMKANRLKPTLDGLGDNKLTQRDADVVVGLFSPFRHRIKEYPEKEGYNIGYFKDQIRFLEVLASRDGGGNSICPVYFDGAVNYFKELPLPNDKDGMEKIRYFINQVRKNGITN